MRFPEFAEEERSTIGTQVLPILVGIFLKTPPLPQNGIGLVG
jgi:hypothetical protein